MIEQPVQGLPVYAFADFGLFAESFDTVYRIFGNIFALEQVFAESGKPVPVIVTGPGAYIPFVKKPVKKVCYYFAVELADIFRGA